MMNRESQTTDPVKDRMLYVEFEAWLASGLVPSRSCFLHTYFTQSRKNARRTTNPLETLIKETKRTH